MSEQRRYQVRLDHPLFRASLSLQRTPKYLRFVVKGIATCSRNWDALDQPGDSPAPGEQVIAAVLQQRGTLHLDRRVNGRRVGEWLATAQYIVIENPPGEDVIRDNERWREWCMSQEVS